MHQKPKISFLQVLFGGAFALVTGVIWISWIFVFLGQTALMLHWLRSLI